MDNILKQKTILFMCPHFKTFIKDQVSLIRPHFNEVIIMIPIPYFSALILKIPHVREKFRFLKVVRESLRDLSGYTAISPKFFTLPLEVLRKRNCYLAAKSCVNSLSKNKVNFDLMHSHFLENGFIAARLKSLYDKPFVLSAHGSDVYETPFKDSWHNALARYILQEADQIITVSQYNVEKLLLLGVSLNKLNVIPNGYDEKLFKPIPTYVAREKLGLPVDKKILLSVGNLINIKGHTYLIDAMRFISKERDDVVLVIVGSGVLEGVLKKKAKKLGLNDKILFVGGKPHEEIPFWMNACDLFVLPSLNEGFPTVVPEAMACGKPVIASNVGGIPEAISSSDVGILVPPKDAESLSQAILEGLHRKWDISNILDHAVQYSWSTLVKQILRVYQKTLENTYC